MRVRMVLATEWIIGMPVAVFPAFAGLEAPMACGGNCRRRGRKRRSWTGRSIVVFVHGDKAPAATNEVERNMSEARTENSMNLNKNLREKG